MHTVDTRPAALAGRFYPAQPEALRTEVNAYLRAVRAIDPPVAAALPKMLLVPHAGYDYSGSVAACAYARLADARGRIRRVVLLGPTHRVPVRGLAIPSVGAFASPLGRVPLDQAALAELAEFPNVVVNDAAHAQEHALEVQLPFLQHLLGNFSLVPLAVGRADPADVARVIEHVWGGDETLVVISSDLSHYLPYDAARARDSATIAHVLELNPVVGPEEACGATPLAGALIVARRQGLRPWLADLRNSGDTLGDRARVVGYAAVVFEAPPSGAARPAPMV